MKRAFILIVISIFLPRLPVMAQDAASTPAVPPASTAPANKAADIAAKEAADERYKRMAADLQAVQSDNESLHAKIAAMEQEIQTLRDALAKPADNSAMQDELKNLAEKIQEVDKKRLEDKDAISEQIQKSIAELEKSLTGGSTAMPMPVHPSRSKPSPVVNAPSLDNCVSYTVQSGQTLGEIVHAYNEDFKKNGKKTITLRQAMAVNPNVDWGRLKVGQKINIPLPVDK